MRIHPKRLRRSIPTIELHLKILISLEKPIPKSRFPLQPEPNEKLPQHHPHPFTS